MYSRDSAGTDGLESAEISSVSTAATVDRREGRIAPADAPTAITTGTTTIGAVGDGGAVLAADTRASLGCPISRPDPSTPLSSKSPRASPKRVLRSRRPPAERRQ